LRLWLGKQLPVAETQAEPMAASQMRCYGSHRQEQVQIATRRARRSAARKRWAGGAVEGRTALR
jgi:hypothetical protein